MNQSWRRKVGVRIGNEGDPNNWLVSIEGFNFRLESHFFVQYENPGDSDYHVLDRYSIPESGFVNVGIPIGNLTCARPTLVREICRDRPFSDYPELTFNYQHSLDQIKLPTQPSTWINEQHQQRYAYCGAFRLNESAEWENIGIGIGKFRPRERVRIVPSQYSASQNEDFFFPMSPYSSSSL